MNEVSYTLIDDEHFDALQEVVNIGMGQAGKNLAKVLKRFIHLSIPRLHQVQRDQLADTLKSLNQINGFVTATRQGFYNHWYGETVCVFPENSAQTFSQMMDYFPASDDVDENEVYIELANILSGACLNGIAEQLNAQLNFNPPSLLNAGVAIDKLFDVKQADWQQTLLVEVNFAIEGQDLNAQLFIFFHTSCLDALKKDLDTFVEQFG